MERDKGYTVEQLRIAFRHGMWAGIAAMDDNVDASTPTPEIIGLMNKWFDEWFETMASESRFITAATTATNEDVQDKEHNEANSGEHSGYVNDGPYSTWEGN